MTAGWNEHSLRHGDLELAYRQRGHATGEPVIALHGWQDNAATFELLGPLLPDVQLIAIDMPGHGRSGWRHREANYSIWSYLDDVLAVLDTLNFKRFSLLGHSMGGAVATLLTSLFPERVNSLVLLDSIGPLATAPDAAPQQMLRALQQKRRPLRRNYYADFASAVAARAAKGLGYAAAQVLGKRGIATDEKGFYWTLDPRLNQANMMSLSEEHAAAFLRRISTRSLLIAAPQYWQGQQAWFRQRCGYFAHLQLEELPGSHHQHLEGQVDAVGELIRKFLRQEPVGR